MENKRPSIKVTTEKDIGDIVKLVISLLPHFVHGLQALTDKELKLLTCVSALPEKLSYTPFALTPRKLYQEWLDINSSNLNTLVGNLITKGYVIEDEYGEKELRASVKNVINMIKQNKEFDLILTFTRHPEAVLANQE